MFKTVLGVYTQNKNVYCIVSIYLEKQKIKKVLVCVKKNFLILNLKLHLVYYKYTLSTKLQVVGYIEIGYSE